MRSIGGCEEVAQPLIAHANCATLENEKPPVLRKAEPAGYNGQKS
jgi:hypothetical protein